MPRVPFPDVPIGEWTAFRPFTAPGLFAYRHLQADELLRFPDLGGGDLSREQREQALLQFVSLHRPLAALVLFLNVVAMEDFIRDLGARLADVPTLVNDFPHVVELRPVPVQQPVGRPFARLDRDPAPLIDFAAVNDLYQKCIGIAPIQPTYFPKLYDLALIRHAVAHHGALIRPIDVQRFQYWELRPHQLINPPVEFVREVASFLYGVGREFQDAVRQRVFSVVLSHLPPTWFQQLPPLVVALIELFNFFGKLVTDDEPPISPIDTNYESRAREQSDRRKTKLISLCIEELRSAGPSK